MALWLPRSGADLCVFRFIEGASALLELSSDGAIGCVMAKAAGAVAGVSADVVGSADG